SVVIGIRKSARIKITTVHIHKCGIEPQSYMSVPYLFFIILCLIKKRHFLVYYLSEALVRHHQNRTVCTFGYMFDIVAGKPTFSIIIIEFAIVLQHKCPFGGSEPEMPINLPYIVNFRPW